MILCGNCPLRHYPEIDDGTRIIFAVWNGLSGNWSGGAFDFVVSTYYPKGMSRIQAMRLIAGLNHIEQKMYEEATAQKNGDHRVRHKGTRQRVKLC